VKFVATKKCFTKNFFHPSLFYLFLDLGSEIRDPGSGMGKNQDPESGIRDKHLGSATLLPTREHDIFCVVGIQIAWQTELRGVVDSAVRWIEASRDEFPKSRVVARETVLI
jgi:hypothetical protein